MAAGSAASNQLFSGAGFLICLMEMAQVTVSECLSFVFGNKWCQKWKSNVLPLYGLLSCRHIYENESQCHLVSEGL